MTITTPPQTRRELVLEAVAAGVHVVADKPFAPNAPAARELAEAAQSAGVVLTVFHNRRWDADIRTLRATLGRLGDLQRIESRFDLDQPGLLETGPHGGLLRDLGSHLVDQMLWLLGPAASVHAALDWTDFPAGRTDSAFDITLTHLSGVRPRVSATKLNRLNDRGLRAYGTAGRLHLPQHRRASAGTRSRESGPPTSGTPGATSQPESWGVLYTGDGAAKVPSERGAYQDYYSGLVAALRGEGPVPVPVREAIDTLAVLDAARASAAEGRVVALHALPEPAAKSTPLLDRTFPAQQDAFHPLTRKLTKGGGGKHRPPLRDLPTALLATFDPPADQGRSLQAGQALLVLFTRASAAG